MARKASFYLLSLSSFTLSDETQRFDLGTKDITDVIFTHLHHDHLAGAFELEGEILRPLFPDVLFYVQEENYRLACHPHFKEKAGYIKNFIEALQRQNNLHLRSGETELFKGITLFTSNGYTKG
ncbi:MAG: MBL fold metallo-hydrolase [Chlorobiales bacterium]|nr:MBL fold metallo-hydrolase [Chlorobiales bacterium]